MSILARPPLAPTLVDAIAAGAPVVTPNKRLARRINERYEALQLAAGRMAWPAATALPWNAWIGALWREAVGVDTTDAPRRLLTPPQVAWIWQRIVAADGARRAPLMDANGAATLAQEAWERMHAWGAGGDSWRGWDAASVGDDPATFARWASQYHHALIEADGIDLAQAPDRLLTLLPALKAVIGPALVCAGFGELSAQQQRFVAALRDHGVTVRVVAPADGPEPAARVQSCRTPRDELLTALVWARDHVLAQPGTTIGIVVEDLAARRDEVRALADEVLCPLLQAPGNERAVRPYDLSLGTPLADIPLVATALQLLRLGRGSLPMPEAAVLARSRHLPGDDCAWMRRAGIERTWRELGVGNVEMEAMIRAFADTDAMLATAWRVAASHRRWPARAAPPAWCGHWRAWLDALGWPGERVPDSAEFQARGAWEELLANFATLGSLTRELSGHEALAALDRLAVGQVFQPEASAATVQILGVLEAAALPFDALWVAGLAADVWPPSPAPNPLLPLTWQRERNLPRCSAARELSWARALTDGFARAAPEVVFSYARERDDHRCLPSALLAAWPCAEAGVLPPRFGEVLLAARPQPELLADHQAPAMAAGATLPGGAGLIERQAECPFRAFASARLAAEPWPPREEGLSARDRGSLVHRALLEFWTRVGDQAGLLALDADALSGVVAAAVGRAFASDAVPAERWRQWSDLIVDGERARVRDLLRAWLAGFERTRPPFRVVATEVSYTLGLADTSLRLRIDRIDELASGGLAIVDYKTGQTVAPPKWFDPRPQSPQLALYALALRAGQPPAEVRALAYARLKTGELGWSGVADAPACWPGLAAPAELTHGRLADWTAVESFWRTALAALAAEALAGHAAVLPRDPVATCRHCGLQPLCRIGGVDPDTLGEDGQ